MVNIGGDDFVRLRANDRGLVKLVCEDEVDVRNPSLSGCPGFARLIQARNECDVEEQEDQPSNAVLFDKPQPKKQKKRSAATIRAIKDNPTVIDVPIPGYDGNMMNIPMATPVRPRDDVMVRLQADVLDHVVMSIRPAGICLDKRTYRPEDLPKGVYKRGEGYVVNIKTDDGVAYKRCKTMDDVNAALSPASDGLMALADRQGSEQ